MYNQGRWRPFNECFGGCTEPISPSMKSQSTDLPPRNPRSHQPPAPRTVDSFFHKLIDMLIKPHTH